MINRKSPRFGKVDKLGALWDYGEADESLARYIPGWTDVSRQGQLYSFNAKKAYAAQTYVDQKTLEFNVILAANTCTNYSSMCIVLLIQIFRNGNPATNIDATLVTVNNFFAHWLKETDITHYPDDVRILPTNNTVNISNYSGEILKHTTAKALDTIKETLLYDKSCFNCK